jgi:hypothetical protein
MPWKQEWAMWLLYAALLIFLLTPRVGKQVGPARSARDSATGDSPPGGENSGSSR